MECSCSATNSDGLRHRVKGARVAAGRPVVHCPRFVGCAAHRRHAAPVADPSPSTRQVSFSRREALSAFTLLSPLLLSDVSSSREGGTVFSDPVDGFTVSVPSGWVTGSGEKEAGQGGSGSQRIVAWYPENTASASDANVSLVITNVGADFTRLGSFGSPLEFGTGMVTSMDRSYLLRAPEWAKRNARPIQTAKLLDAVSVGSMYQVDYMVTKPDETPKRLRSLVSLGFNGTYNRLYTLTAQCTEDEFGKYETAFDQILKSFEPPHLK